MRQTGSLSSVKFVFLDISASQIPVLIRVKYKGHKNLYCGIFKSREGGLFIKKVDKSFTREIREQMFKDCEGDNFCA